MVAKDDERDDRTPTRRMVLRRAKVLIVPEGATNEQIIAAQSALAVKVGSGAKAKAVPPVCTEAWEPVGEQNGDKRHAIEGYAGKANTPDAKPGSYKAPTLASWKGGEVYDKPPEPKVERRALED